ncbi:MAG: alpha/beta fold hydrolase [Desulfobacterales bacterium]|nr:alpha/beta fold hydrolase [Desulfobacterales bacterium]
MRNVLFLVTAVFLLAAPFTACAQEKNVTAEHSSGETVVLLHGLGRSKAAMWLLANRLEKAGFNVQRIGYDSIDATPEEIIATVTGQIQDCCVGGHRTVHFVGHSLGGLIIRAYLDSHHPENLGSVVLIGTPNQGTPIVDRFHDRWWMKLVGPTALALNQKGNSFPKTLGDPYYPVGVIAGKIESCLAETLHGGKSDGLVPVASTRVNNMTDFMVVETGHSAMRYDSEVARQAIAFLRSGRFEK